MDPTGRKRWAWRCCSACELPPQPTGDAIVNPTTMIIADRATRDPPREGI
jgi:hypothetical protein